MQRRIESDKANDYKLIKKTKNRNPYRIVKTFRRDLHHPKVIDHSLIWLKAEAHANVFIMEQFFLKKVSYQDEYYGLFETLRYRKPEPETLAQV